MSSCSRKFRQEYEVGEWGDFKVPTELHIHTSALYSEGSNNRGEAIWCYWKLDLHVFNGDNLDSCLLKVEKYFIKKRRGGHSG